MLTSSNCASCSFSSGRSAGRNAEEEEEVEVEDDEDGDEDGDEGEDDSAARLHLARRFDRATGVAAGVRSCFRFRGVVDMVDRNARPQCIVVAIATHHREKDAEREMKAPVAIVCNRGVPFACAIFAKSRQSQPRSIDGDSRN